MGKPVSSINPHGVSKTPDDAKRPGEDAVHPKKRINPFHPLLVWLDSLNLRTKLLLSYVLLVSVPIAFLSVRFYDTGRSLVADLAAKNAYQIIRDKNEILDAKLSKVQESSLAIIKDRTLFELFDRMDADRDNMLSMDRKITNVINNYFPSSDDVYEVQIATSYYIFGNNFNMLTGDSYVDSALYRETVKSNGRLNWVPTYDFTEMYGHQDMKDANFEVRNVFSAARLINCFYLDNGVFTVLNNQVERPVLIIHFRDEAVGNTFRNSIPVAGTTLFMLDSKGTVVSHTDPGLVGKTVRPAWLDQAIAKGTGTLTVRVGASTHIICFDTSSITGWLAVAEIPTDALAGGMIPAILLSIFSAAVPFLLLALLLAFLIAKRFTRPIDRLVTAMRQVGDGNFGPPVPVTGGDELGYFTQKFNDMNERIRTLIDENYKVKLREKETEIMALNLQLNPHFLYNTLNIINWMAIEAGNREISDMLINLCDMLVYTVRNNQDMVPFADDRKWLSCYLFIMSVRFEDKFTMVWDVDPALDRTDVPKLFLQPFVENAMLHGFEAIESGGIITISGKVEGEHRHFQVRDNGKGMDLSLLAERESKGGTSIGIANVDKRIRLLFGEAYGVTISSNPGAGTCVDIVLPVLPEGLEPEGRALT